RSTNDVRGDVIPSSVSTHVALNGSGYFLVAGKTGAQNGVSQFGQTYYTRRGDFELDRDGYLVNGAGYHLQGVQIENGVPGTSIGVIKVNNQQIEPKRSERIDYQLNLPGRDDVAAGAAIDGGSLTLYTPKGTPTMVELQWQKTSDT